MIGNRAELFFQKGETATAIAMLQDKEDRSGLLSNEMGNIFVKLGRWEEADEAYKKALERTPDDPDFLRNRASCLVQMDRYGEADDVLSRLVDIDPGARTLDMIAYVAIKKGEYPPRGSVI